jgi:hypothetical protein
MPTFNLSRPNEREAFESWSLREMRRKHLSEGLGIDAPGDLAHWMLKKIQHSPSIHLVAKSEMPVSGKTFLPHEVSKERDFVSSMDEAKRIVHNLADVLVQGYQDVW